MDVSCPRNRWNYPPRLRFGALPAISKTRATKKSTSYQKVCPRVGVGSMTPDPLSQCIPMSHALFWSLNSYEHWLLSNHTINKLHSWLMADSHFPVYQMKFQVSNSTKKQRSDFHGFPLAEAIEASFRPHLPWALASLSAGQTPPRNIRLLGWRMHQYWEANALKSLRGKAPQNPGCVANRESKNMFCEANLRCYGQKRWKVMMKWDSHPSKTPSIQDVHSSNMFQH